MARNTEDKDGRSGRARKGGFRAESTTLAFMSAIMQARRLSGSYIAKRGCSLSRHRVFSGIISPNSAESTHENLRRVLSASCA